MLDYWSKGFRGFLSIHFAAGSNLNTARVVNTVQTKGGHSSQNYNRPTIGCLASLNSLKAKAFLYIPSVSVLQVDRVALRLRIIPPAVLRRHNPRFILSLNPTWPDNRSCLSTSFFGFLRMSSKPDTIALFIDGANLYATAKTLGFDIDYRRLLREFQSRGTLLRAFYYTAIIEDQEFSSIRPLLDWLDYNGFTVVTKATKEFIDASGRRKVKGNMDIELAVDAMELAEHIDQMVLFSGDGDFRSLVEAVQRRGVRVTVISTISSQPPMIADELRRQADVFTDLVELQSKLGRDPSERPAPREPRHHAPQFLQRATTVAPRGDDDDFDD